jgi:hypothetical protein
MGLPGSPVRRLIGDGGLAVAETLIKDQVDKVRS